MSSEPQLSNDELAAIADQLRNQGEVYTRRDVIKAAGITGSAGVLAALGIDPAEADHGEGGQFSNLSHIETNQHSGPVPAPDSGSYRMYAESDGFKEIAPDGTVNSFAGVADGEDFDGKGTSDFTNLNSVGTDEISNTQEAHADRSIQAAIDALPNGGGEVVIRPSYDEANETLPIQVYVGDKPIRIRGGGHQTLNPGNEDRNTSSDGVSPTVLDFSGNSTDNVFEIIGEGESGNTHSFAPGLSMSNIAVLGGNHGFVFDMLANSSMSDLYAFDQAGDGFRIENTNGRTPWNNTFHRCMAYQSGGDGFHIVSGATAISTGFIGCMAYFCYGNGVNIESGAASRWLGGTIAKNDDYGVRVSTPSVRLAFAYIEENRQENNANGEVFAQTGADGFEVLYNRFTGDAGGTDVSRAVVVNVGSGESTYIEGNDYRGYANGFARIVGGSDNNIGKNNQALDSTALINADSATRTRYGGMIAGGPLGGADIGSVFGQFEGDEIRNEGPNAVNSTLWTWDDANTQWVRADGGTTVTPS